MTIKQEKIINPDRYGSRELKTLKEQQTVERAWSEWSGMKITKERMIAGFSEEVMELRAELFDDEGQEEKNDKIDRLGLSSEVADHILYILGIATYYEIDFENAFAKVKGMKAEDFDLTNYQGDRDKVDFYDCQRTSEKILDVLMKKNVDVDELRGVLLEHYENMAALAGRFNLSLSEIVSRKVNRNYHKYVNLKQHLLEGKTMEEGRRAVKMEWSKEEDERFMRDFFVDYIKSDDYAEISQMVHLNFNKATNYESLTFGQKMAYKEANTEEETKTTCENPDNVLTLVARTNNAQRKIVGYVVVRQKANEEEMAVIKRFHVHLEVAANKIGQKLLMETETLLKEQNFKYLEVGASGASSDWFRRQGFGSVGVALDTNGIFLGTDLEVIKTQMLKVL